MTATYALLGDPIEHSPSPALYRAAFEALAFEGRYEARRVTAAELPGTMRELAALGGGNVTTPHKLLAAAVLDLPSDVVSRTGACNCFWGTPEGRLAGDNTDVAGFLLAVQRLASDAGVPLEGSRALVLGAGGAARAALVGLQQVGGAAADVLSRRPRRAEAMLSGLSLSGLETCALRSATQVAGPYELVINATPLGLRPDDPLPINLSTVDAEAAFDCVYGWGGTRWTRHATELGIRSMDGLEMLMGQAGLSVRNWIGLAPPLDLMRSAATAALAAAAAPDGG